MGQTLPDELQILRWADAGAGPAFPTLGPISAMSTRVSYIALEFICLLTSIVEIKFTILLPHS